MFPNTALGRIALSWFGLTPRPAETWARYHLRWFVYSLDWLGQIAILIAILMAVVWVWPEVQHANFVLLFSFALTIASGMALLAAVAFGVRAAKAVLWGPNPVWNGPEIESIDV